MKLDRLIARHGWLGRRRAHERIGAGRVRVDDLVVTDSQHVVDRFMRVVLDGEIIQDAARRMHVMLHKPAGHVSATTDAEHPTALDLVEHVDKGSLHIAGRLDRASTGLLLLTNDGRWSKRLMHAEAHVPKTYRVETAAPLREEDVQAFAAGFHFLPEDIVTLPAQLEILGEREARVTLREGRHHQIKRMFGRLGNRVLRLHRERIGGLHLPSDLAAGQWRHLTPEEIALAVTGMDSQGSAQDGVPTRVLQG